MNSYKEIAHAKLNLFLSVGNRFEVTGLHSLESAYFPLLIGDVLEVNIREVKSAGSTPDYITKLEVKFSAELSNHLEEQSRQTDEFNDFLCSDQNLISQAIKVFFNSDLFVRNIPARKRYYIRIKLLKLLPDKAGLAGGSSDAAAILRILARHFSINKTLLYEIATTVGADVLPCLINAPSIYLNNNEKYKIINSSDTLKRKYVLLAKPPAGSDTKQAFSRLNRPISKGLPVIDERSIKAVRSILSFYELANHRSDASTIFYFNDFEEFVFSQIPDLQITKNILLNYGAEVASLTGSGSTIYGVFNDKKECQFAITELKKKFDKSWWLAETAFS